MVERELEDYVDDWGLYTVGENHDGGDSCANHATLGMLNDRHMTAYLIHMNMYNPRRHPDRSRWYGLDDRFSRDQLIPLIICLAYKNFPRTLKALFKTHLKKGWLLFAWNTKRNYQYPTFEEHRDAKNAGHIGKEIEWKYKWKVPDVTAFEVWAIYIRAFQIWYLYPLLYLFDLETLIGTVVKNYSKSNIHRNHIMVLYYGMKRYDTLLMKLARKIYDKEKARAGTYAHYGPTYPPNVPKTLYTLIGELDD